jgi:hypothetical protein
MFDSALKEKLEKPFPKEMLGSLNKGGTRLTYVPVAEIINRLNEVLGIGGWSYHVKTAYRDSADPDWIIAHVQLVLMKDGSQSAFFDGFGGQKIKRTKSTDKDIVDLGDEFKGAVSDGLKKAAQALGVGLDLARKEEAKTYSEPEPGPDIISDSDLADLEAKIDSLTTEQRGTFKKWWLEEKLGKIGYLPIESLPKVNEKLASLAIEGEGSYAEGDSQSSSTD